MATKAGHVGFKGLTGQVQTGCPNTPGFKSLYCSLHKPAMVQPQRCEVSEDGDGKGQLRANNIKSSPGSVQEPVGLITGKTSTRNSTFSEKTYIVSSLHYSKYLVCVYRLFGWVDQ